MEIHIQRGCGLDVHQATIVACLLSVLASGKVEKEIRTFGTTTRDLVGLREWLQVKGCTHVAMESTGVYWKQIPRRSGPRNDRVARCNWRPASLTVPTRFSTFRAICSSLHVKSGAGCPGQSDITVFANVYLNPLDHFVLRELQPRCYVRYVDDFLLFGDDKTELRQMRERLEGFLCQSAARFNVHGPDTGLG